MTYKGLISNIYKQFMQFSIKKKTHNKPNLRDGQKNWTDLFPKSKCRWPIGTWKDAQYGLSSGKCKSKPQGDIISYLSEWASSKRIQITNAAENVDKREPFYSVDGNVNWYAAAAAKSLQSCPTLCNPIDGSPLDTSVPGILQERTLEWVAISFSNAGKRKVKVKSLSLAWLLATLWTVAYQAPLSMGFSGQEYWSGVPLPSP